MTVRGANRNLLDCRRRPPSKVSLFLFRHLCAYRLRSGASPFAIKYAAGFHLVTDEAALAAADPDGDRIALLDTKAFHRGTGVPRKCVADPAFLYAQLSGVCLPGRVLPRDVVFAFKTVAFCALRRFGFATVVSPVAGFSVKCAVSPDLVKDDSAA